MIIVVAPTAGPTNVQVSNTSSTSLRVTWNRPPQNETHGMIRQYILRCREVECDNGSVSSLRWNEETVNGSTTSFDITGLIKWNCYEVQVRAVTIENGVWSEVIKHRTSEDGKMEVLPTIGSSSF